MQTLSSWTIMFINGFFMTMLFGFLASYLKAASKAGRRGPSAHS